jgi:hypothetical protein
LVVTLFLSTLGVDSRRIQKKAERARRESSAQPQMEDPTAEFFLANVATVAGRQKVSSFI